MTTTSSQAAGIGTAAWRTRITRLLGIRYPILQAGMGDVAMAPLAAAVSQAGGLGVLGAIRQTPEQLDAEIRRLRELTDQPFGVDLVLPKPKGTPAPEMPEGVAYHAADPVMQRAMLDVVFAHRVPVLVCAMFLPEGAADEAHQNGAKVLAMVGKVRHALRAERLGADAVITTGYEAGGHTGAVAQSVLTRAVADQVEIPVIAGGGIVDGRGLAAAIMLGADAVWMGTRFVATAEATAHPRAKQAYLELNEDDTVISRAVSGKTVRIARNEFAREWEHREIKPFPEQAAIIARIGGAARSMREGEVQTSPLAVGQGVALVHDIPAVSDLIPRIIGEAAAALAAAREVLPA